ncbi:MAG: alpha/beta fold hydrolase [Segniliparus sp.]|uniref:alpha/beta fold hydrolase n=1 Tax=Segniliparus sp. TaxID=2804064 RepID=UPI003F3A42CD
MSETRRSEQPSATGRTDAGQARDNPSLASSGTPPAGSGSDGGFFFLSSLDAARVFVRKWLPPVGIRRRATVQITHGISEHSGRYSRLAEFLAAHGAIVYALDLRGHGLTAGPAGLGQGGLDTWDRMTADIKQLSDIALAEHPGLPLVAFGHSMGSALVQSHIERHGTLLAGAILCGTMGAVPGLSESEFAEAMRQLLPLATGPEADAPSELFGSVIASLNAPFAAGVPHPTGCEWQTSDAAEVQAFLDDPLCGKPFSNSMTYSVFQGFHSLWLPENEAGVPLGLPLLIIAGAEDPVGGKTSSIQALIARYLARGHRRLSVRFFEGGRHEILNEPEKDQVHREIGGWFAQHLNS